MNIQFYHWLVLGVILMIAEMFVPTFFLLWLGVAAVVVGILTWVLSISLTTAVIVWAMLSVLFCVAWLKFIQPKLAKNRTKAGLGAITIVGETGMIIRVPNKLMTGSIRFSTPKAGVSEWECRTNDDLQLGETVVVLDVVGNELLVGKKLDQSALN